MVNRLLKARIYYYLFLLSPSYYLFHLSQIASGAVHLTGNLAQSFQYSVPSRASPKSATLAVSQLSSNTFRAAKSRWTIFSLDSSAMPAAIWKMNPMLDLLGCHGILCYSHFRKSESTFERWHCPGRLDGACIFSGLRFPWTPWRAGTDSSPRK